MEKKEQLAHHDFSKFNPLKPRLLETVDKMLAEDIAKLMAVIPNEVNQRQSAGQPEPSIKGGAFEGVQDKMSPFGFMKVKIVTNDIKINKLKQDHSITRITEFSMYNSMSFTTHFYFQILQSCSELKIMEFKPSLYIIYNIIHFNSQWSKMIEN